MGNAVRRAAIHAREQIMEAASPMLEAGVKDLDYEARIARFQLLTG